MNFEPADTIVASYRLMVDMFDSTKRSFAIMPLGQCAVLNHQFYNDQTERFLQLEYNPMYITQEDVLAHTKFKLVLLPMSRVDLEALAKKDSRCVIL